MPNRTFRNRGRRLSVGSVPGWVRIDSYLLRDEFLTDAAAPMGTNPITRNAEPGPGQVYLSQQDGVAEWHIVDGVAKTTANSSAAPIISTPTGFTRTPGLAFKHRTAQNPIGVGPNETVSPSIGWGLNNVSGSALLVSGLYFWTVVGQFGIIDNDNTQIYGIDTHSANTFYEFCHILRSTGSFAIVGNKLAGILARDNTATMYPMIAQSASNRHPPKTDYVRVAPLGGPWASDFGIATTRLAGARAANDTFTHEVGAMWIDFVLTTLPSSGNVEIEFRRTDANNCWKLQVTSAGAFNLIEVVSGTPTTRANINGNANGDRLLCVMDGANARLMRARIGASTNSSLYTAVSTFTTQPGGVISSLGTGGAVSDLVAWPRTLSGEALAWVNAL